MGGGIYIYHPQASHNALECNMNGGGGGKVPRQRSLTCVSYANGEKKPELMVFRVYSHGGENSDL